MYAETSDASYLQVAEDAATYLKNEDQAPAANEMAWRLDDGEAYGDISHRWVFGTPGVGVFLMELEDATSNATYGWWAQNVSLYMQNSANLDNNSAPTTDPKRAVGTSWTQYRSTNNTLGGYWHGAAGIADFFLDIYEKYGDTTAYQYANSTYDWMQSVMLTTPQGRIIENVIGENEVISGWSRGQSGVAAFFARLANVTGNATIAAERDQIVQWLINNATINGLAYQWDDNHDLDGGGSEYPYTGRGHGMAGIGEGLLEAYKYTQNSTYLDLINNIYAFLQNTTLRRDGGAATTSWKKSTIHNQYDSTIYYGTAGVGLFMLGRANMLNDSAPPTASLTATVSGSDVDLSLTTADADSGLFMVIYYVDGVYSAGTSFSGLTISSLADGEHTFTAVVYDGVGNAVVVSKSVTIGGDDDDTPPGIPGFDIIMIVATVLGVSVLIVVLKKKQKIKRFF